MFCSLKIEPYWFKISSEIVSSSFVEVASKLNKLDFQLIRPERLKELGLELIGGRYCSIQGHIAAQLHLKDIKTGSRFTLYQVPHSKDWPEESLNNFNAAIDGVEVSMWVEKGLLLALAGG